MNEVWKTMPNNSNYLVSNLGRVARIMVIQTNSTRRHVVHLTTGKWQKRKGRSPKQVVLVHRAVLEAFVGPPPTLESVGRHLNDVPNDNRVENLAWGTRSDNHEDARRNGVWGHGEKGQNAKLKNVDVYAIRAAYDASPTNLEALAKKFGVHASHICGIGKRRFWKYLPEQEWGK